MPSIICDGHIVYGRLSREGERRGVIRCVFRRVLDENDEVVYTILLIIRNDEKDLGKYLAEFQEM